MFDDNLGAPEKMVSFAPSRITHKSAKVFIAMPLPVVESSSIECHRSQTLSRVMDLMKPPQKRKSVHAKMLKETGKIQKNKTSKRIAQCYCCWRPAKVFKIKKSVLHETKNFLCDNKAGKNNKIKKNSF